MSDLLMIIEKNNWKEIFQILLHWDLCIYTHCKKNCIVKGWRAVLKDKSGDDIQNCAKTSDIFPSIDDTCWSCIFIGIINFTNSLLNQYFSYLLTVKRYYIFLKVLEKVS